MRWSFFKSSPSINAQKYRLMSGLCRRSGSRTPYGGFISILGSKVECSINGTVVARYDKALLVTGGKLKSTHGTYGLRFAHNTDVIVTGLKMTKE